MCVEGWICVGKSKESLLKKGVLVVMKSWFYSRRGVWFVSFVVSVVLYIGVVGVYYFVANRVECENEQNKEESCFFCIDR